MISRADRNNTPAAIITLLAAEAGLVKGTDYVDGDAFPPPSKLVTARLLHDPVALTIKVIDAVGYQKRDGGPRWTDINIPKFVWAALSPDVKKAVVLYHYKYEGGTALLSLFD